MNPLRTALRSSASLARVARPAAQPLARPAALTFARQAAPAFGQRRLNSNSSSDADARAASRTKDANAVGPFTWKAAVLFILTGGGLYVYFTKEKEKVLERKRQEHANKSVGRPNIGGPFNLIDQNSKPFTEQDLLGKWTLMYFGFTNCPDICPEELDKMSDVVERIDKENGGKAIITPIFISVDPARDGVPQVAKYVEEFHPRLIGLTGEYDEVKRACKSYRVYFSTPPDAKATDDYLVDHSIFFYLMDPLGQFVDAFGKNTTADEVAEKVRDARARWEAAGGNKVAGVPEN